MRFVKLALMFVATVSIVSVSDVTKAKADILLEPYLGYTYGTLESKVSGVSTKYDNNNLNLGARVGWQFLIVMAGVDYQMPMSGKFKGQSGAGDFDASGSTLYAFAGARLPVIRAYAGYPLMNEASAAASGTTTTYSGGSGLKLGASFTAIPLIAINAEYITNSYSQVKSGGGSAQDLSAAGYDSVKNDYFMVSVSAPLSF
ncbi:MAG: hypothetical protein AAB250_02595 [Bdellovibrionota bacterium]